VLLVDLDDFKRINDTLGHSSGDHVLVEVAGRLREVVRAYDTVGREFAPETLHTIARLGGDEFLVAIADLNSGEDAAIVAGRVLKSLATPLRIAGQDLIVSASIGISVFPEDGADLESLLKHADVALYQAKDAGRNTGEFFNQSMNAAAHQRLLLETNLRRAVERDEIAVHFQPLVDARTGRPIGVEALLRWTDPELGPVAPVQFVPVAERIGLIAALTELTLRPQPQIRVGIVRRDVGELGARVPIAALGQQLDQPLLQVGMVNRVVQRHQVGCRHTGFAQDAERPVAQVAVRVRIECHAAYEANVLDAPRLPERAQHAFL
jgi:diguanylate cyclase (GGDEF)-like protein